MRVQILFADVDILQGFCGNHVMHFCDAHRIVVPAGDIKAFQIEIQ